MNGLLKYGMIGAAVAELQKALNCVVPSLGQLLVADGIFGNKTLAAVRKFQNLNGLVPDGIVGPKTNLVLIQVTSNGAGGAAASPPEFLGFSDEQIATIKDDTERAKRMLDDTIERLAFVPFAKKTPPDIKAVALKNIFHTDFTLDVGSPAEMVSAGFNGVNMLILGRSLGAVRKSLDVPFPKVFHPPGSAPPAPNAGFFAAWVDTSPNFDPTMHISHNYFDPNFTGDAKSRSLTVIHERAHTILKLVGHPGTGDNGFPDGKPHNGSHLIKSFDVAQRNAYAYEWLIECFQFGYNPNGI